ncbi:hypothetical protein Pyn_17825 [Prunus yedoensis var. nudiflora]|uniref:Uncharacterized protein n=1 Tax=Prunus yedoensis var. nudiflora TaxID=2094558 RepID=A0A314UUS1_PRUYE|nr:hypothetical protein Pyn_17825 [Prunus yedoensis var. nudiflora]
MSRIQPPPGANLPPARRGDNPRRRRHDLTLPLPQREASLAVPLPPPPPGPQLGPIVLGPQRRPAAHQLQRARALEPHRERNRRHRLQGHPPPDWSSVRAESHIRPPR